jgi:hypothetical protein
MKALVLDLAFLLALEARYQLHDSPVEMDFHLPLAPDGDLPGWRKNNRQNRLSGGKRTIPNVKQGTRMDLLPMWVAGWWI